MVPDAFGPLKGQAKYKGTWCEDSLAWMKEGSGDPVQNFLSGLCLPGDDSICEPQGRTAVLQGPRSHHAVRLLGEGLSELCWSGWGWVAPSKVDME